MRFSIVETTLGRISGIRKDGYTQFKGIRYAKAPVGQRRFKAPEPIEPWDGLYGAHGFGSIAPQTTQLEGQFYQREFFDDEAYLSIVSEDCLYLNIWTPNDREAQEKFPVAFWIHGGAFMNGYGHEKEFDGEAFCRKGVILVSINYRMGPLGFLAHPDLSLESPAGVSGNYGILDQIEALKWVYQHISSFGGDPERITVFGQSAGAMSVQTLISSPLTKGMISGAILQSGGGYRNGFSQDKSLEIAEQEGIEFLKRCQVDNLSQLRECPYEVLIQKMAEHISKSRESGKYNLPFVPNIDGYVMPSGYDLTVEKGQIHDIAYMLGSTKNDMLVDPEKAEDIDQNQIHLGCVNWSLALESLGRSPAYIYNFAKPLPGNDDGAFHSSELWYVFGTIDRCWRPMDASDHVLSEKMLDYWTRFVKFGNPNNKEEEQWLPYEKEHPYIKIFE